MSANTKTDINDDAMKALAEELVKVLKKRLGYETTMAVVFYDQENDMVSSAGNSSTLSEMVRLLREAADIVELNNPVVTPDQHALALKYIENLMRQDPAPGSPKGIALLKMVAQIERYEAARFSIAKESVK